MVSGPQFSLEILDVQRVARLLERFPACKERLFCAAETSYCDSNRRKPHQHYAARLAAKFAVRRLLGGGRLLEIEVGRDALGAPFVSLHGSAETLATGRSVLLSLSHEGPMAVAYVALEVA